MEKNKYTLSIVDFLVGVAVLMILAALFVPHFIQPDKATASEATRQTAPARPGR